MFKVPKIIAADQINDDAISDKDGKVICRPNSSLHYLDKQNLIVHAVCEKGVARIHLHQSHPPHALV